ncbi:Sugar ABC transporter ATP-binding protein OS=Streptomyces cyaneofuscatus OX=66883 GN=G3I52_29705 PE=4 SV=1 [Streptomyces cyaneofuscatus]
MDEPTAVLTSGEVDKLFAIVRQLRTDGVGIVFITHHLEEIAALGDRVTVLRDGRASTRCPPPPPRTSSSAHGRPQHRAQYPRERTGRGRGLAVRPGAHPDGSSTTSASTSTPVKVVGLAGLVGPAHGGGARGHRRGPYDAGTVDVRGRTPHAGTTRTPRWPPGRPRTGGPQAPGPRPGRLRAGEPRPGHPASHRSGLVAGGSSRPRARRAARRPHSGLGQHVRTLSGGNQRGRHRQGLWPTPGSSSWTNPPAGIDRAKVDLPAHQRAHRIRPRRLDLQ